MTEFDKPVSQGGWATNEGLKITRVIAQPSRWTFQIPPIKALVERVVGDGKGWADPFSGESTLAEFRNDLNPEAPSTHHMLAEDFAAQLKYGLEGVLFDPPYSYRQITECYKGYGLKATALDTSANFYSRVRIQIAPRVKVGGLVICCGWNTSGMGAFQGFELVELLVVNHLGHHNDTLVTVERKVKEGPPAPEIDRRGRLM